MASSFEPGSLHQLRSKSMIARCCGVSAILATLPLWPERIKHLAPRPGSGGPSIGATVVR